jgi:hypothetical protein
LAWAQVHPPAACKPWLSCRTSQINPKPILDLDQMRLKPIMSTKRSSIGSCMYLELHHFVNLWLN